MNISIKSSNIEKVKTFLANLSSSNFSSLASLTKLVEVVTKTAILEQIKVASSYSILTPIQQGLISEDLMDKVNKPDGTLKVIINF